MDGGDTPKNQSFEIILGSSSKARRQILAEMGYEFTITEIGDFENWMKTMELECKSITAAICNIHQT